MLAIVKDGQQVDVLEAGEEGRVVLDATPFYAEKGGQIGDTGVLAEDGVVVAVLDTKEPEKGLIAHTVKVESGRLSAGDAVHAAIAVPRTPSTLKFRICGIACSGLLIATLG